MSVPHTPGLPYYYKVESVTDTTATYRMLYFEHNVEPESQKWSPRVDRCCIVVLALGMIHLAVHIEDPHASKAVKYVVNILQVFVLCVQFYCVVRNILGHRRESWKPKGRGYDLSVGPAYTYTFPLPPVGSGLDVPLPPK